MINLTEKTEKILVGIDVGVNTGVAFYSTKDQQFTKLTTTTILKAMIMLKNERERIGAVYVEDARQVKYKTSRVKAQGAGSVTRDCQIWEEYLEMLGVPFTFVRPNKKLTKLEASVFNKMTGFVGTSSYHSRDAAMLVFGRKMKVLKEINGNQAKPQ